MSEYIPFTDKEKQCAASVDLEEFLRCQGEKLISSGREKRLERDHSVTIRGNEWYDHAEERGGHSISFVQHFYNLNYQNAVLLLLGHITGTVYPSSCEKNTDPAKPFALPPANNNIRRVFAYLVKKRCIDQRIVAHFAKAKLLYEDAEHHNAVFVGKDEYGIPRHAHQRSTNSSGKTFRINVAGSDPKYSFHHIGTTGSLYVFESPIDMLSYITIHPSNWQANSYVACCGISIQPVLKLMTRMPAVTTVHLCLDNDEAGQKATQRMIGQLKSICTVKQLTPSQKDWNDELRVQVESEMHYDTEHL